MPSYKVASADVRHHPLLRALAATGKPVILSTGGADLAAVRQAYEILRAGTADIAILQCTAGYPAAWEELDLRVIETYRDAFPDAQVGLSSHDNGIAMATAAYVLGARVIEKHFTLDRTMRGTDHKFSLEPVGMRKMVRDLERVRLALGDGDKKVYESEKAPISKMSKSLVAARELSAGHVLTVEDLAFKSPGDGLAPSEIDALVGATLLTGVRADTLLTLELVEFTEAAAPATSNGKGKGKHRARDHSRVFVGR
jgi:N-acetylneuraminate synthase/sialic acid synthase